MLTNLPAKISEEEANNIIKHIQENRERRKQGLPIIKREFAKDKKEEQQEQEQEQQQQQQPPILAKVPEKDGSSRGYAYLQSQIQNQLAYFQAARFAQIADEARKEKHIIYKFDENPEPPKLGEKKNTKQNLIPIDVYYNEIPNSLHYKLDKMRSQVQDLTYVKSLQTATVDEDGHPKPAVLVRNDKNITGVEDVVFARINEEIDTRNKEIAALMAYWMYGIDEKLLPHLETSSLSNALEAGLYREMYGLVQASKNLAVS